MQKYFDIASYNIHYIFNCRRYKGSSGRMIPSLSCLKYSDTFQLAAAEMFLSNSTSYINSYITRIFTHIRIYAYK